jgi:hypothetical protein
MVVDESSLGGDEHWSTEEYVPRSDGFEVEPPRVTDPPPVDHDAKERHLLIAAVMLIVVLGCAIALTVLRDDGTMPTPVEHLTGQATTSPSGPPA